MVRHVSAIFNLVQVSTIIKPTCQGSATCRDVDVRRQSQRVLRCIIINQRKIDRVDSLEDKDIPCNVTLPSQVKGRLASFGAC